MEKINYWTENSNKAFVNAKLPGCSANNFYQPSLSKVSSKIEFDDDFFVPKYSDPQNSTADIFIKCDRCVALGNLCSTELDCGFSIHVSNAYRIRVELCSFWTNKGLILDNSIFNNSENLQRFKIRVLNIGKNQIIINNKEKIGKIWVEPVYYLSWI